MSTFHQSHLIRKSTGKRPRPRLSPERRHTFCASLRNRNACPHVTKDIRRATLHGNLQEKCRGPDWAQEPRRALCASLRSRNARQDFTRAILHGNLQEKAATQSEHPDQAPAITLTGRTPQCSHTVWGKTPFSASRASQQLTPPIGLGICVYV